MPFTPYNPDAGTVTPTAAPVNKPTSGFTPYAPPIEPASNTPLGTSEHIQGQESWINKIASGASTIAKSVGEIALQPARFIERTGKAIGTIGQSEETKKKVEEFYQGGGGSLQEQVLGKDYATPAYNSPKEALGGAIQAGANLATPAVGGVGALAAQGAALAGGKAIEDDKSLKEAAGDAAIGGITSAAIGQGTKMIGGLIGKGKDAIKEALKPLAKRIAPSATGLSKKEITLAFDQFPEVTAQKLKIIEDAATPEDAQAILRTDLLKNVRGVAEKGKQAAETQFDDAINAVKQDFPNVKGNLSGIYKATREKLRGAVPVSADEKQALEGVSSIIRNHRDESIDGMRVLLKDLWNVTERTEQGTPARRIASQAWSDVRDELSRVTSKNVDGVTKSALDDAFSKYGQFKENWLQLKPVWGENINEDTARNFVSNLSSSNKTASRDAIKYLEGLAGIQGAVDPEITIHRLAQHLAKDQKITGSRLGEILLGGAIYSGGGAIGEAVGGEKGKGVAQAAGAIIAGKALAPAAISKILLNEFKGGGVATTNVFRQQLGKLLSDPRTSQILMRIIQGSPNNNQD